MRIRNWKHRLLSLSMCLALALTLLPAAALADGSGTPTTLDISKGPVVIDGDTVTIGTDSSGQSMNNTSNTAGYIITGTYTQPANLSSGTPANTIEIGGTPTVPITLQGLSITSSKTYPLMIDRAANVTLGIAGSVSLHGLANGSTPHAGIYVAGRNFYDDYSTGAALTLKCSDSASTLTATADSGPAISVGDGASLTTAANYSGGITATSTGGSGVYNEGTVNLSTIGDLSFTGTEHALHGSALSLSGGTVSLSKGSSSDSLITGSTVSVTATGKNGLTLNGSILAQGDALSLSAPNGPLTVTGNIASKNNDSAGNATLIAGGNVNVTGRISAIATINTNGAVSVINESGPACTSTLTVPYTDTYKARSVSVTGNSNNSPAVYQPHIVAEGNIALTNDGTGAVCQYDLKCESKSGVISLTTGGTELQVASVVDSPMSLTAPVIVEILADKTQVSLDNGTSFKDAAYGGDAGSGLDLSSNTPTAATCYKAGSGYVLFTPAVTVGVTTPATVTLHNAAINNTATTANSNALALPSGDVTVTLDAGTTNTLSSKYYGLYAATGSPTIGGSGTLNAAGSAVNGIHAGGSLTIQDSAVITATGKLPIYAKGNISVNDSSSITAIRNDETYPALESDDGSVTLNTTGTVSAPEIYAGTTFTHTAGTMPGSLVEEHKGDSKNNAVHSVYGSYTLNQNMSVADYSGEDGLTVNTGATLTISSGKMLTVENGTHADGVPKITNNGTLVNNGTIVLPATYATENGFASMTAAIEALKLTGTGTVTCGENTYGSDGVRAVTVSDNTLLDLRTDPTDTTRYTFAIGTALWTPTLDENGAVTGGTLTLNGATLGEGITFPAGTACVVDTVSDSTVSGPVWIYHDDSTTQSLTFRGSGKLTTNGITDSHNDLRFEKGAQVTVNGIVNGKTVTITGSGTKLTVSNQSGEGIEANGVFTLSDGATADLTTLNNSGSVLALKSGGGSVTGGSTLKVNGYIGVSNHSDSKFTVDATSTLIANCTCAAVNAQGAENTLSLANLPSDAEFQSVSYTDSYAVNITFWTLVKKGDKLTVGEHGAISGALATLTLKPAAVSPSGGGSTAETPKVDTKTNADGSVTKTETTTKTDSTGAVTKTETQTTTAKDGTITKVETAATIKTDTATGAKTETVAETKTAADGTVTKTETVKVAGGTDGVTAEAKVETGKNGKAAATATVEAPATATTTTLPAAVVKAVTSADTAKVTVKVGEVSVALDKTAVEAVKATGGEAPVISATPVAAKELPADLQGATKAYDFKVSGKGVNFGGGSAVVSMPYTKTDSTKAVAVYHVDAAGNKTRVYDVTLTAGTLNIPTTGWSTYAVMEVKPLAFTDVKDFDWFYGSVAYALDNHLFKGTSAAAFSPSASMTRQQMWMVLARIAGKTPATMADARNWAVTGKVSDGSNGASAVTREQFVTLLWRAAGSPKATKDMSGYTDFASVGAYAKDAMTWAVANGIVSGTSDTTLGAKDSATRAQIAVILARYSQNLTK